MCERNFRNYLYLSLNVKVIFESLSPAVCIMIKPTNNKLDKIIFHLFIFLFIYFFFVN